MTFLKNNDSLLRLEIQYKAFLTTKNLTFLNNIIDIAPFQISVEELGEKEISILKINPNLRLGNRLEHFLSFSLKFSNDFSILAKNIQIVENKITLGELDYIIQDNRNDSIFHLELANKFYLYGNSILNEVERWIGPNGNDSLMRKIKKLDEKQFPLLYHNQTIKTLTALGIDVKQLEQKILFNTQLFLPINLYKGNQASDNVEGFYISQSEFQHKKYQNTLFFVPEKQDWQVNPTYCENWYTYHDIQSSIELFLSKNKSPLVWLKNPKGSYEKFFIVWW